MDTLIDLFERGGATLWLVTATLLIGATHGIERLIALTRNKCAPKDFEKDVVHIADLKGMDAAVSHCRLKHSALGRVLIAALVRHGSPRAELESAVRHETRLFHEESQLNANVCGWMSALSLLIGLGGICADSLHIYLPYRFQNEPASADGGEMATVVLGKGIMVGMPGLTLAFATSILLLALFALSRGRAKRLALDIEVRAIDAVVTLDRKARQSIRLVEDLEDRIKTESMIKIPDLSAEFEDPHHGLESAAKTAVTTHESMPAESGSSTSSRVKPAIQ